MATTYTYTNTLRVVECCVCHQDFAMQGDLYKSLRATLGSFYCPQGHGQHFTGPSKETQLRAQLDQAQADARWQAQQAAEAQAEARHQAAVAAGHKGALTKVKKRIGKGVCPCCNRHFANVERHMATQHPGQADG